MAVPLNMFPVVRGELACILPSLVHEVSFSREALMPGVIREWIRSDMLPECEEGRDGQSRTRQDD